MRQSLRMALIEKWARAILCGMRCSCNVQQVKSNGRKPLARGQRADVFASSRPLRVRLVWCAKKAELVCSIVSNVDPGFCLDFVDTKRKAETLCRKKGWTIVAENSRTLAAAEMASADLDVGGLEI